MSSDDLNLADPSPAPPPPRRPDLGPVPDAFKRRPKPASDYVFPTRGVTFLLALVLTCIGGYLRFWRLGQQSYWCDEAATAERICGTYDQLVAALGTQAFPPGWYVLMQHWLHFMQYWTGSAGEAFKPENLRLLPAALGTLTVPAMYLLARQFMDRRGALLATLLTAVNPFLIYYSRDIKMYAGLYFFLTLHTALFFKWLSVERWYIRNIMVWPLVALSGVAMLSLHNIAWFIVGMELLWILTHRHLRALTAPLWAASVGMMAILPVWWQLNKSNYLDRALNTIEGSAPGVRRVAGGGSADLGLGWIQRYTDMSWHTIIGLPTTHLTGFLWPEDPVTDRMKDWFDLGTTYHTLPWLQHAEWYVGVGLLTLLFVGLLPWRAFAFSGGLWRQRIYKSLFWKIFLALPFLVAIAAFFLIKMHGAEAWPMAVVAAILLLAPGLLRAAPSANPKPPMRGRAWWIALWIFIPVTVFAFTWMNDNEALEIYAWPAGAVIPAASVISPGPATVTGTLTSLTSTLLTIQTASGPVALTADNSTTLTLSGRRSSSALLRPGMKITAITNPPWRIPFTNIYLHHNTFWGTLEPTMVWEPRYLGIVVPAFLLWLAAALRGLPTWPLRAVAITGVVAVCTASALSNNLTYRQAPFEQTAEMVKKYMDPKNKDSIAYGTPAVEFSANSAQYPFILELGGKILWQPNANRTIDAIQYAKILPLLHNDQILDALGQVPRQLQSDHTRETDEQFLLEMGARNQIQTIVLTDRLDGPDKDLLPDSLAQQKLGSRWELKETVLNNWYYEWRFYIYHTWRTRVWVRKPTR